MNDKVILAKELQAKIAANAKEQITIMEVCGTHTHALFAHGIRSMLPPTVNLISGPGCPVCVTSQGDIDAMVSLSEKSDVAVCTFGDMMRVPGTKGTLQQARSEGADIRLMYSPFDVISWAKKESQKQFVLVGIGFETTTPSFAATIKAAKSEGIKNISLLSLHKSVIAALDPLANIPGVSVDGLMLPGHVTSIVGADAFKVLPEKYGIPGVVTGFEALDMLASIEALVRMKISGKPKIINQYTRVVKSFGNPVAMKMIDEVFSPCDSNWRGMGVLPGSGLMLADKYKEFDAVSRFDLKIIDVPEPDGCICGQVITGSMRPTQCPLFATSCTPTSPVGPCMVSGEGTCSAYYKYRE
ncbi:MAG TPA: hydrogenase formation protein HypD [Caldisericia bacterium]|nr:hydrogenase formation protein HypD [Caldisericia bacterium]HPF48597.1 hydrogenase formation protein HypD [Caldisericia bacterium]HPI83743.1 hydrogenase formation protein HypD [Caldisericia bacterium]HPQ93052.1 hydrogenase formation protein HypD [Caldisericia bacterium]HRV75115.1 hydrogenase formation protein HypD [Caldisericia bacterium]